MSKNPSTLIVAISRIRSETFTLIRLYKTTNVRAAADNINTYVTRLIDEIILLNFSILEEQNVIPFTLSIER